MLAWDVGLRLTKTLRSLHYRFELARWRLIHLCYKHRVQTADFICKNCIHKAKTNTHILECIFYRSIGKFTCVSSECIVGAIVAVSCVWQCMCDAMCVVSAVFAAFAVDNMLRSRVWVVCNFRCTRGFRS